VIFECVVNISEGRDGTVLAELANATNATPASTPLLLDTHRDPDHHRSVFTLAGAPDDLAEAVRRLAEAAVSRLDLTGHGGAHPRFGVLDVVPFTPYRPGGAPPTDLSGAVALRDDFARWLGTQLGVPSFLYGPHSGRPGHSDTTLPQLRKQAFAERPPDFGPPRPHRTAGATAVGARPVLIAYNVWVSSAEVARLVAPRVRNSQVRALGLDVGDRAQVSCNLIDPAAYGPARLYDAVAALAEANGGAVLGAELVGLLPQATLQAIPAARWAELGLSEDVTVEARFDQLSR
jgi:glutamate formiminotransferase